MGKAKRDIYNNNSYDMVSVCMLLFLLAFLLLYTYNTFISLKMFIITNLSLGPTSRHKETGQSKQKASFGFWRVKSPSEKQMEATTVSKH